MTLGFEMIGNEPIARAVRLGCTPLLGVLLMH
jgi:hypothetical protein